MSEREPIAKVVVKDRPVPNSVQSPILTSLDEMYERLRETLLAKNEDYAGGKAFHNFEVTAQVTGMTREMGVLVRICDKVSRIGMLLRKEEPAVKDESLLDTIEDLVGYATILRAMVIEGRGKR